MNHQSSKRSKYFHDETTNDPKLSRKDSAIGSSSSEKVPRPRSLKTKSYISDVDAPFVTLAPRQMGGLSRGSQSLNALSDPVRLYLSKLALFKVKKSIAYFDRRVTCIEWHPNPTYPTVVALASKGGDLIWYDYTKNPSHQGPTGELLKENGFTTQEALPYLYGQGAGGSITAMKFHPTEPKMIYTTSIDGTVKKQDFEGRSGQSYLDTMNKDKWYTALDVSSKNGVMAIGSNTGEVLVKDLNGNSVWASRAHKSKCHAIEFHPVEDHYFVTAGNDKMVRLWDLRMLQDNKDENAAVKTFPHEGILNSATFSLLPPFLLLTTAQNNECRVYDVLKEDIDPMIQLPHPHRPFQHLTPIVGNWHSTLSSVFLIGRYPDADMPEDRRTVDVFQVKGHEVRCVARLEDERITGIQCIAKFNKTGDILASCSGFTTYLWDSSNSEFSPETLKSKSSRPTGKGNPNKRGSGSSFYRGFSLPTSSK